MDELKKTRVKESVGKNAIIFQKSNGWKFEGKITNADDDQFEILDTVSNKYMFWEYDKVFVEVEA